jgi:hypothetical protein
MRGMRSTAVLVLLALPCTAVACAGNASERSTETGSTEQPALLTADAAAGALRNAGFRVSLSPVMTGSGIDAILFVDINMDVRVEVAIFATPDAAEEYRRGIGSDGVIRVRNSLILGGTGFASERDRERIATTLRSA